MCNKNSREDRNHQHWIDDDTDILDSPWYKEGVKLVDKYVEENDEVKFSQLCKEFTQFVRVMDQIIGTLEIDLKVITEQRHVRIVKRMPEEEVTRRTNRRRQIEGWTYGHNAAVVG
jgi:hypothetical protein